jgi:hypothetical protein
MPRTIRAEDLNSFTFDGERVLIERDGEPLAAVVPLADLALLRRMEDEEDFAAARAAKAYPTPVVSFDEAFAFLDQR